MTKFRNASLVGSSLFCLACLGLPGCGSNDPTTLIGGGGSSGASNPAVGGLGGAATTGGSSTSSTTTASNIGGSSNSSSVGGTSNVGGTSQTSTAGGTSSTSAGGTSSQGGSAVGGTSTTGTGGAGVGGTSKGGSSAGGAAAGGAAQGGNSAGGTSNVGGTSNAGGTSAAGTTGTSGATSKPVTPSKVSDKDYTFTMTDCKVVMNINPQIGARVTKLTYGGSTNVITPYTCTGAYKGEDACNNSGSTFWTSPQSVWPDKTWPPVAEIDGGAYNPVISGTHLVATGTANSSLGASVIKDFSADDGTCWVTLLYTIKATKAIQAAPWEISRVPRGGLAFFPQGDASKLKAAPLTVTTSGSPTTVWFDDKAKTATSGDGSKLIADGAGGWLAYVLNGNLFLKKFSDVQPSTFAPSEGDVEIYPGADYLELEVQGAYTTLAANATLPWTVQWRVVPIPSTVTVAAGNAGLLAFVQAEAAK